MKLIVSHDIDHLTLWEHARDLILIKTLFRNQLELLRRRISFEEYVSRYREFFTNKMNYLEEMMAFDRQQGIPASFFIAVNKGLGLAYSLASAKEWADKIIAGGFELGMHGIAFDDQQGIDREHEIFVQMTGLSQAGIRMHYLRSNTRTLQLLEQSGYAFDSSHYSMVTPYKVGNIWEFPVHMMDCFEIYYSPPRTLSGLIEQSRSRVMEAVARGISHFTVIFHDRYYTDNYSLYKDWYQWFIQSMKEDGFEFTNFSRAVAELETDTAR